MGGEAEIQADARADGFGAGAVDDVGETESGGVEGEVAGERGEQPTVQLRVADDIGIEAALGDDRRLLEDPRRIGPLAPRARVDRERGGAADALCPHADLYVTRILFTFSSIIFKLCASRDRLR
ncbi:hypothetical protein [Salinarimonas sp.]|uniref:hypothetical protein n=1 Tax=Salinarimonas sp. TaxID=2766526 RepID=UPI00391D09A1